VVFRPKTLGLYRPTVHVITVRFIFFNPDAEAMHTAGICDSDVSVCVSVRQSHVGIVSK